MRGNAWRCFCPVVAQLRQKKSAPPDQLVPVTVRFTPAQLAAVEAAAESLGIDRAQYIRMGALRECGWSPQKPAPVVPIRARADEKTPS